MKGTTDSGIPPPAWTLVFLSWPHHTARVDLAWPILARAGVDIEQAKRDMQAPEIARLISQDVADARSLNVSKTPEYFVNGRPMPSFGYEQLQKFVQGALDREYR